MKNAPARAAAGSLEGGAARTPPALPRGAREADPRGGRRALFLAHPWSKVPGAMTLEEIFGAGLDGVEVVNGVIHGGDGRIRAALDAKTSLFGVIDYKFGPHVTAITLIEDRLARTPEGVAKAVREGRKFVLYAIPGGPRSAEEWKAAQVGLRGALDGLDSLREAPRARRAVWFAWGVLGLLLWWLATRSEKALGRAAGRVLFVACAAADTDRAIRMLQEAGESRATVIGRIVDVEPP